MEETGFNRLEDFRGIALKNILSYSTDVELQPVSARVNRDLCNGCGLCLKPAHCGVDRRAVRMIDGKAEVETEQCLGCGSCSYLCSTQAISMVQKKI
jgi:Pyruvate/2-oxoacid:ferredoxin oxidoreductase delta subunit